MCYYTEILGQGAVLIVQLITIAAITISIAFWVWMYRRQKTDLMRYALPIMLWIVFGTLDIVITAKGTMMDPMNEGNPLAREIFLLAGGFGPPIASILWISLWSLIVLVMNKRIGNQKVAACLSLAVFYSLAVGHFFGFSSWFAPLCWIPGRSWVLLFESIIPAPGAIVIGCVFAAMHMLALLLFRPGKKEDFKTIIS